MEYLATSTITLTSLAQLLGKISNMVINDHIQEQVEQALKAIHQVRKPFICQISLCFPCGLLRCEAIAKFEQSTLKRVLKDDGFAVFQAVKREGQYDVDTENNVDKK